MGSSATAFIFSTLHTWRPGSRAVGPNWPGAAFKGSMLLGQIEREGKKQNVLVDWLQIRGPQVETGSVKQTGNKLWEDVKLLWFWRINYRLHRKFFYIQQALKGFEMESKVNIPPKSNFHVKSFYHICKS